MAISIQSWGQTTYDWIVSAPDGYWKQGAAATRWNPGGLYDAPPSSSATILQFNNNTQAIMDNNVAAGYIIQKIVFGSSATSARSIGGNAVQFYEYGSTWPRIQNNAANVLHTINFSFSASTNSGYNMELAAASGPIGFGGTINNNGRTIYIYGNNSAVDGTNRFVRLSGAVSGTGALNISQYGVAKLNTTHTYTGQTQLDNGELWIESAGSISASSTIYVGNGGTTTIPAKLWLYNPSGGTIFNNALTINNGNTSTRLLGGLNTSGTHTFSGNITNNTNLNISALTTGGTTAFSGIISGSGQVTAEGAGTIILSGQNTYTGATTISAGTTRLGVSGGPTNSPLGTTGAGTTVASGAVLDLNGYNLGIAEALTLNSTGISSGGALINNPASTTNATYSGLLSLGSAASIVANNGSINLSNTGTISGAGFALMLGGASGGSLASVIGTAAGSLTKEGSGTWILSGASTYTGATTVNAGMLQLSGGANRLPASTAVTLANTSGAAIDLNGQNQTFGSLAGGGATGGNIILGAGTLTVGNGVNTTFSGNISGTGGFTKQGAGTLTLAGANTYTGTTTLSAGIALFNSATAWSGTSSLYLGGGSLSFANIAAGASLGATATAGTLNLQANTTVNLGTIATNFAVSFANSSAVAWDLTKTLTISNWTPTSGKIIKFPTAASLTTAQLGRINFDNYGIGAKLVLVGTEYELRPTLLYITLASGAGNFSAPGSWINSDNPIINDGTAFIYVQPGYSLTQDVNYNLYGAEIGGTLVMGSFGINIFTGGQFKNAGSISMTSGSNINMATGTTLVHTGAASYTAVGNINFAGVGTISGAATLPNVTIGGAVDFGTASTIGNGSALTINAGGSVNTNAPVYATGSTLKYNSGGVYGRTIEWSATTGAGYPYNVQIGDGVNTELNLGNGGTSTARYCAGSLTISAGSKLNMNNAGFVMTQPLHVLGSVTINGSLELSSVAPGDLYVGGDYTEAAGTVLTANNRAVFFNGSVTANQTITKTGTGNINFPYLIVDKANNGNVRLSTGTNVVLTSTTNNASLNVLQLTNGNIDLNDGSITLTGSVPNSTNIKVGGGSQRKVFTSTGTGDFIITGTFTAGSPNMNVSAGAAASTLLFDNNVKITTTVGLDFGASGMSLINATLQLNTNGFVINNAPDYGNSSVLVYNNGAAGYNRNFEWRSTSGAGFPNNIIVQGNTPVSLNTIAAPADLGCSGNITIEAGSALNMNAMPYDVIVAGNITIDGNLTLSTATGPTGDLRITGNWARGTSGTFTQNQGIVFFTGTTNSQLTAAGTGEVFTKLYVLKTATGDLTLNSAVLVNNELNFSGGLVNSGTSALLTMASGATLGGTPGTSSYVNGPMCRYINSAATLLFPIGKAAASVPYRPLTFVPDAGSVGTTDYFTANFFNSNPPAGFMTGPNLQGMLKNQYWQLDRSGSTNGAVNINYIAPTGSGNWLDTYTGTDAPDPTAASNTVEIAKRSSADAGAGSLPWGFTYADIPSTTDLYTPYNVSKSPLKTELVSSFSYFGFGYSFTSILPIKLLSFQGQLIHTNGNLSWTVASTDNLLGFELQYSTDGINYKKLVDINANNSNNYTYVHAGLTIGKHYYKLMVKEKNGTTFYSSTVVLMVTHISTQIIGLAGNLLNNGISIKIISPTSQTAKASVIDALGRKIQQRSFNLNAGTNQCAINFSTLSSGVYFINIITDDHVGATLKFIKQ